MDKPITKKLELDFDQVELFLNKYDYWGGDGWVLELLNGNIDLDLMRQAVWCHSVGNNEKCQKLVDKMFIAKWWEK
jgi:hypothetical protein